MAAPVTVGTTATVIAAPNQAARFLYVVNNSAQVVYVSFDGTVPTVANGYPLAASGGKVELFTAEACMKGMQGIVAATTADVRVQMG